MRRLVMLLMVIGFAGVVSAGGGLWWGVDYPLDRFWMEPANWENGLPTSADTAYIVESKTSGLLNGPVIQDGDAAVADTIVIGFGSFGEGPTSLTMTGGTLNVRDVWMGKDDEQNDPNIPGIFDLSGGTVTISGHLILGSGSDGTVNQTGNAVVTTDTLALDWFAILRPGELATYNLHSGTLNVNYLHIWPRGHIDIETGTMIVNGDITADILIHVKSGAITAYGGTGLVSYNYNITNIGKTTVMALDIPCPEMDFTHDCVVDFADFAMFAAQWMVDTRP